MSPDEVVTRPSVSVVVPFAGTAGEAATVIERFRGLTFGPGDELIIADNSGTVPPQPADTAADRPVAAGAEHRSGAQGTAAGSGSAVALKVVRAAGEASASHARNTGAAAAGNDWILFLDADVHPPVGLLDAFFREPIPDAYGVVTGDIHGIPDSSTLASRYGTARNFLGQRSHVMNPYRPRASSANLLVRRAAFEQAGGYTEGIWAAEDTDFTWRLQAAGWKLGFNEHAVVEHEYRKTLRALGRQWRGYAAGARWLSRTYPDFKPDPGLNRLVRILLKKVGIGEGVAFRADGRSADSSVQLSSAERLQFFLINCYLGVQEQIGLRMSNTVTPATGELARDGGMRESPRPLRVDLLDPPAYSPPYDDALAAALARAGADVELLTSHFAYGDVPAPVGYVRREPFYRGAIGAAGSRLRTASKLALHIPQLLSYRRTVAAGDGGLRRFRRLRTGAQHRTPDIVHVQWLTVPWLDLRLLPRLPTVLTIHDPLSRGPLPGPKPDLRRLDAVVVHSEHARQAVIEQHRLDPEKVHVIRHGVLGGPRGAAAGDHGAGASSDPGRRAASLPPELPHTDQTVVLCFGLIRPYKGIEVLLEAWEGVTGAQLWIVGRPMMDLTALQASAPANVHFLPRFVTPAEEAALYARADIAVLPYERSDRFGFSGVLATALGHGKAIVLSAVGGLAEVAERGAARAVAPSDPAQLHAALQELIDDPAARAQLAAQAAAAAVEVYSWQAAARSTLELYDKILNG